ncbi:MAG: chemotaxis protein CheR [Candidatus Delongbacteria bacterium]|nr:chemotaxis protein CheR [Candidatus Delongbacteria bacterium]
MAFTYFFRDFYTLELAVDYLLPTIAGRSSIRIWDAGCAMGQEPYTLAILLAEKLGHFAFKNIQIFATDIDHSNLFETIIQQGIYPFQELERIPSHLFQKYFSPGSPDNHFQIEDRIRQRVKYYKHDLLSLTPITQELSLIVCKNVLLHFQPAERILVYKMFHNALADKGILINEQTQKLPDELNSLYHQFTQDAQIFQKR